MKTNLQIELTDDERAALAAVIDGKKSSRLISRKEVIALAQQHISGLMLSTKPFTEEREAHNRDARLMPDIYKADPEDISLMARPNDPGYVRGWNLVKRS